MALASSGFAISRSPTFEDWRAHFDLPGVRLRQAALADPKRILKSDADVAAAAIHDRHLIAACSLGAGTPCTERGRRNRASQTHGNSMVAPFVWRTVSQAQPRAH
jgi:hypothetical protein